MAGGAPNAAGEPAAQKVSMPSQPCTCTALERVLKGGARILAQNVAVTSAELDPYHFCFVSSNHAHHDTNCSVPRFRNGIV